jgi:hypothetical protein
VTKQITLPGSNVMLGAMRAYCKVGPMKLTKLYSNHYVKNKCTKLIFVDTLGKYLKKTKQQIEMGEKKMKAKGKQKAKSKCTEKMDKDERMELWDKLEVPELQGAGGKENNEHNDKEVPINSDKKGEKKWRCLDQEKGGR